MVPRYLLPVVLLWATTVTVKSAPPVPGVTSYVSAYGALAAAYSAHVTWEPPADCEKRTAALLPGLMLARIDGKSPVEYLAGAAQKDAVRRFARSLLGDPVSALGEIARRWLAGGTT